MATKIVGCGTILEWDPAGGTAYEAISLIRNVTPGNRVREEADGSELGSCGLDVPIAVREGQSEVSFTQFWEPADTDHEKIDTAFDDRTNAAWRIVYPTGSTAGSHPEETFTGYVLTVTPETIESTGVISREVTLRRTSAITRASVLDT